MGRRTCTAPQCLYKGDLYLYNVTCCDIRKLSFAAMNNNAGWSVWFSREIIDCLSFLVRLSSVGKGLLIIDTSLSHSDTPHSVGLLWTSDKPEADTATWLHTTLTTDIYVSDGIRTRNLSKQAAADPCLRQRGQRQSIVFTALY